jgi:hypothetical protein
MSLWRKRMNYDRKYCAHCNMFKPLEGGGLKPTKGSPRWVCKGCLARIEERKKNVVPIVR